MYFPTTVGARWVYAEDGREWTEVVTGVEVSGQESVVAVGRVGADGAVVPQERVTVSARGLVRLVPGEPPVRVLEPPPLPRSPELPADPFPVEGASWLVGEVSYWVSRPERVEVPAEVYLAARVRASEFTSEGRALVQPLIETCWYAPGVGLVRRTLTAVTEDNPVSERVLMSFSPGK